MKEMTNSEMKHDANGSLRAHLCWMVLTLGIGAFAGCDPKGPPHDPCIAALCPVGTMCTSDGGDVECVPFDAGAPGEGEACGDTVCGEGMVCCNDSCGICTPPDGACIQIECTD